MIKIKKKNKTTSLLKKVAAESWLTCDRVSVDILVP